MRESRTTLLRPRDLGSSALRPPVARIAGGLLSAWVFAAAATGCAGGDDGPMGPAAAGDGENGGSQSGPGRPGATSASTFLCDRKAAVDPGPSPLQRLTPAQYIAVAHDLFGAELSLEGALPAEASASHIGLAQPDPSQVDIEHYSAAARRAAAHVEANIGDFAPCEAGADAVAAQGCARDFLQTFGTRIYRSPLESADLDKLLAVFEVGRAGAGYAHGVALVVEAMLQSPRFLYRPELGDVSLATETAVPLTPYEIASRLSFAFWNRGPDEVLLKAAAEGALNTPEGIAAQASRLTADPRSEQSFRDFLRQWFGLTDWDTVEKDPALFPTWSEEARSQLNAQSEDFFDAVLFSGEGTLDSLFNLDAAELASDDMTAWTTDRDLRTKGVLGLPALLSRHAKPTESFPIYRGLFVREQLLCQSLPPPPSDVGEPPPPAQGVSSRDRFEQHSSDPACRGCHTMIDPVGFAFENYDAIGRFRSMDEGHPIDASGQLSGTDVDGPFADLTELSALLAESETVRACTARQWFRFVMQRFEQPADGCSMQNLAQDFAESGHRFAALRAAIVQTPAFRMRRPIALEGETP